MEIKKAKAMHHLLSIVHEWRQKYHTTGMGDIIFQNKRLLSNVIFKDSSFHTIQKHSAGFENIPEVISNPDEVWSKWEDVSKQHVVLRAYIKFGEISYLVQTRDGIVIDAFAVSNAATNKFRSGVLI